MFERVLVHLYVILVLSSTIISCTGDDQSQTKTNIRDSTKNRGWEVNSSTKINPNKKKNDEKCCLELVVRFNVIQGLNNNADISVWRKDANLLILNNVDSSVIQLEYDNDYIFYFTKMGYITKRAEISTQNIPLTSKLNGFEPFEVTVALYPQPFNKELFNAESIARIFYNDRLDEFDYDLIQTSDNTSISDED